MTLRSDLLELPTGSVLNLQLAVPDDSPRYPVRLIGSLPGASLVVTAPEVDGRVQIVREGQRFNVRVLKGERVIGFVATVLSVALRPYAHLHLEYPTEFEEKVVRNASRVNADLPVEVQKTVGSQGGADAVLATVVDLSETGARLASDVILGQPGDMLFLRLSLIVGGASEDLSLMGEIRSVVQHGDGVDTVDDQELFTGIAFDTLNRYQQVLLHAWVTRRLLDETLHAAR